jgi:D-alanyl-D-alanine carboxypeptidase/D-alanyl-D-alanine-endopeptidase (penicillin-binding protein 4)
MKPDSKKILLWFVFVLTFVGVARADLGRRINAIVNAPSVGKVSFAVNILDPATGAILYSRNASTPMVPASNMKIVTTAAALRCLGPDFTYQTSVGLMGNTLAIVGCGDPLLGDKLTMEKRKLDARWVLKDIAEQLRQKNVTAITDVVVDSTIFDDELVNPSWPQKELNRRYAAEVSGLNYNGNCVEIIAETVGNKVELTLDPPTGYVEIINKCLPSAKPPDTVWGARPPGSNVITVSGACHKRCEPVGVAIDRPAAFFGYILAEELKRSNIAVTGRLVEREISAGEPFQQLVLYRTSLWDVFERCNKDSFGLAAEALLKTIAAYRQPSGKGGSWLLGRQLVYNYLLSLGIPQNQFFIDDGSGLSEKNRLSASTLSAVLLDLYRNPNWQRYKQTLAVGGQDGTIDKDFTAPKYKGKVFGKTGYIEGVKAFSGVCSTPAGDRIFVIITNHANGNTRPAINDIVEAVIDESR